jgi:hypothetical protein
VSAAELPAPQLGRILIAAGLLSEEQLAQALDEQERTGRRLGEIIVQRGFISGPALANALAEQHGGVLKTEYGFASGLGGVVARRAAAESGTPISPLRPPDPEPMPTLRAAEAEESPEMQIEQEEAPEPIRPVEAGPESEPEPPSEPPPLLRPVEPPAPAFEEPSGEPGSPPGAVTPLSSPEPPAPAGEPSVGPAQTAEDSESVLEPEPKLPAEAAEPVPASLALRPLDPEPVQETPRVPPLEPDLSTLSESELTASTEAAAPIPEPVGLRPPALEEPQPVSPAPEPVSTPEVDPTPAAEAAEPVPEPVELRPPDPEPAEEPVRAVEPEREPMPSAEVMQPVFEHEPTAEPSTPEEPAPEARDDRDELIDSLRARIEVQEIELANLREQLEQERGRKEVQVHVWPDEQPAEQPPGPVQAEQYLLCVPTSAGYVLLDRVGALPTVGQAVEVPEEEGRFTVTKVVRLPRNGRPCAYLQRA